ncbi:hypothetical protein QBC47DRAFT_386958 [Echria macrotheca]|uniref:Uncharacterized protein n=1 Tax=Echria macrotheca TaxID=438768 RepID=A0AAJ0B9G9_9PEZI|nr:hypothetical protein QBC47DRAFT_386958 [Echria macrotheca]
MLYPCTQLEIYEEARSSFSNVNVNQAITNMPADSTPSLCKILITNPGVGRNLNVDRPKANVSALFVSDPHVVDPPSVNNARKNLDQHGQRTTPPNTAQNTLKSEPPFGAHGNQRDIQETPRPVSGNGTKNQHNADDDIEAQPHPSGPPQPSQPENGLNHKSDENVPVYNCPCTCKSDNEAWDTFFQNIGAVATLGAGFTFALILTDIKDPHDVSQGGLFDLHAVRILLSVSWFLFMTALVLSFSLRQSLPARKSCVQRTFCILLYYLDIGAVACLALVVSSYVQAVGYLGLVLAAVVTIAVPYVV